MNKREIILFGVGFLVGYMVIGATRNNVVTAPATQSLPDTSAETIPPATAGTVAGTTQIQEPEVLEAIEDPKIDFCKQNWIEYSKTIKFGSSESMQNTYDNFMTSCIGKL